MFNWGKSSKLKKDFEEKILECIDSLYNLALRMTQHKQDAEDLTQEAVLRAYRFLTKFEEGTNFKAWIMAILRNVFINEYRRKTKEPQKIEFEKVEDFITIPEISGVQEEIFTENIKSSIDKLPEELRTTIILFYAEDFSYKEIAKIMDVPVGTVMSRLYTAKQSLKRQLSAYEKERKS